MEIVLHLASMELVLVVMFVTALKDGLVAYAIKVIYTTLSYLAMVFDFHITAICIPQCGHGTCIQPDVCACDPGWTGLRCNEG